MLWSRIRRISIFFGRPDPLVRDTDPDTSIIKQNSKKIVFFGFLKAKDENIRIRIHCSEARIPGSVSKCHGSTTLLAGSLYTVNRTSSLDLTWVYIFMLKVGWPPTI
jgi:hypothetical protein